MLDKLPQPILWHNEKYLLAKLVDDYTLPVLLERGEQPFLELYSNEEFIELSNLSNSFNFLDLVQVGEKLTFYKAVQVISGDDYRSLVSVFKIVWNQALKQTKKINASYFNLEVVLKTSYADPKGYDFCFELGAELHRYKSRNSLS